MFFITNFFLISALHDHLLWLLYCLFFFNLLYDQFIICFFMIHLVNIEFISMISLTTLNLLSLWSTYLLYICYLYDLPDYSISVISMIYLTTLYLLSLWFVLYCLLRNYVLWAEFPATREKLVNFLKPPQPWISPYSLLLLNLSPYSPILMNISPYSPLLLNLSLYS